MLAGRASAACRAIVLALKELVKGSLAPHAEWQCSSDRGRYKQESPVLGQSVPRRAMKSIRTPR